jgi:Zn-dependent protease with chaperone function/Zn-finger nucleic acid-binding protein
MELLVYALVYLFVFLFHFLSFLFEKTGLDRLSIWFLEKLFAYKKTALFLFVFLLASTWLSVSYFGFNLFSQIVLIASVALLVFLFFYAGLYPAELAAYLVRSAHKTKEARLIEGYWSLYNRNKFKRESIMLLLVFLLTVTLVAELFFFFYLSEARFGALSLWQTAGLSAVFVVAMALTFLSDRWAYHYTFPVCEHKDLPRARRLLETVAITAGLPAPRLIVIKTKVPLAFSEFRGGGAYDLSLSLGLLSLLDDNELSALFAHELAKIKSGISRDYHLIVLALHLYKALCAGFVLLLLGLFSFYFYFFWAALLLFFSWGRVQRSLPFENENPNLLSFLFIILFPNFVLTNFFSTLIFYLLSYQEVFLADLQAVLLTRFPEALHRALGKIKADKPGQVFYGARLDRLYFTTEGIFSDIPMPQPAIDLRLRLLERLDAGIKSFQPARVEPSRIKCLLCHHEMESLRADSHYIKNFMELDRCRNCLSVWFDSDELWYLADLLALCDTEKLDRLKLAWTELDSRLLCPRCGVILRRSPLAGPPDPIGSWKCPSCDGFFLLHNDVYKFGILKKEKK